MIFQLLKIHRSLPAQKLVRRTTYTESSLPLPGCRHSIGKFHKLFHRQPLRSLLEKTSYSVISKNTEL